MQVCLSMEDVLCGQKWILHANQIASKVKRIQLPSDIGDTTRLKDLVSPPLV